MGSEGVSLMCGSVVAASTALVLGALKVLACTAGEASCGSFDGFKFIRLALVERDVVFEAHGLVSPSGQARFGGSGSGIQWVGPSSSVTPPLSQSQCQYQ